MYKIKQSRIFHFPIFRAIRVKRHDLVKSSWYTKLRTSVHFAAFQRVANRFLSTELLCRMSNNPLVIHIRTKMLQHLYTTKPLSAVISKILVDWIYACSSVYYKTVMSFSNLSNARWMFMKYTRRRRRRNFYYLLSLWKWYWYWHRRMKMYFHFIKHIFGFMCLLAVTVAFYFIHTTFVCCFSLDKLHSYIIQSSAGCCHKWLINIIFTFVFFIRKWNNEMSYFIKLTIILCFLGGCTVLLFNYMRFFMNRVWKLCCFFRF